MIKSIENDDIRIGSAPDLVDSMDWGDNRFVGRFKLPLFSVFPKLITISDLENDKEMIFTCIIMLEKKAFRYL